ncbi:MAG: hypothetical protein HQK83_12995 [Fibrobacteria bacterium]|nr:hypothetical protein [Fibrobacteria bacterium]
MAELSRERDDAIRERDSEMSKFQALEAEAERLRETVRTLEEIHSALNSAKRVSRR